jgi:hypothetical protein
VGKYGFIGSFVLYLAACSGEKYANKILKCQTDFQGFLNHAKK